MAYSKLKALLKKAGARTIDALWGAIAEAIAKIRVLRTLTAPVDLTRI